MIVNATAFNLEGEMPEGNEKKAPKPAAPAKPEKAPKPVSDKPHHIKVTQMSLAQVEEALNATQKQMGNLRSQYALALQARKEFLMQQHHAVSPMKKAA